MKQSILYIVLALTLAACGNEDPVKPTNGSEEIVGPHTLPQGNHPYDKTIREVYDKTGSLLLYKFSDTDFAWGSTQSFLWSKNRMQDEGYLYALPEEAQVGEQVSLLKTQFLDLFPTEFLKKHLPLRILLCGKLFYLEGGYTEVPTEEDYKRINAFEGYEYFAVNWGSSELPQMTKEQKDQFRQDMCTLLLRRIYPDVNKGAARESIPQAFTAVSAYGSNIEGSLAEGFLNSAHKSSEREDWFDYLKTIVSTPLAKLEASDGVLSHELVRRKYDIVIRYFKEQFNVDLQRIGNMSD